VLRWVPNLPRWMGVLLLIGLLVLVIFGPGKAASMTRDLGRFVGGAQACSRSTSAKRAQT
jgi:Sec-independent protein translocase protein TatA